MAKMKTITEANLKGKAMLKAIEAGMIPKASNGKDYNIAHFMEFWELFEPIINDYVEKSNNIAVMIYQESKEGTTDSGYDGD